MNTAHTPQALSLPHLQIAEVSARRSDETDAFERAAARLRPAWLQVEKRDVPSSASPAAISLHRALRRDTVARSNAEADQYRRRLLGDLARSHRTVRRAFIAAFVAACAVLALTESRPAAQAHRAEPAQARTTAAPVTPKPAAVIATPTPAAPAAQAVPSAPPTPQPVLPTRASVAPAAWKQPAWKARAAGAPARWQPKPAAIKRPAIAPKRMPAQPAKAQRKPAAR